MVGVCDLPDFSVSPIPLGTNWVLELIGTWFGLGLGGLGLRVWGQGLTIESSRQV